MDGENVTILVAFAAGALVRVAVRPATGAGLHRAHGGACPLTAAQPRTGGSGRRFTPLVFVLGFTIVFVAFWVSIGLVGYALRDNVRYLRQAGGAVLIFMGFHLAGVINLGFLNQEHVYGGKVRQRSGFLRSFSLGLIFAAGWTPCIGPVLGAVIIGLAAFDGESGARDGAPRRLLSGARHAVHRRRGGGGRRDAAAGSRRACFASACRS